MCDSNGDKILDFEEVKNGLLSIKRLGRNRLDAVRSAQNWVEMANILDPKWYRKYAVSASGFCRSVMLMGAMFRVGGFWKGKRAFTGRHRPEDTLIFWKRTERFACRKEEEPGNVQ